MRRLGFNTVFGAVLVAIFIAVSLWQSPGILRGKLSTEEIAHYLSIVEQALPFPPDERPELLARLRAWAEADDGKPVYMLNLMRYHEQLRALPGAPSFAGTPREANALYEKSATPLLLARGAYPMYASVVQGKNILGYGSGQGDWSRVLLVRYPSRRAFLELLADPAYAPIEPYKLMAMEVLLVPTTPERILPNPSIAVGVVLLMLFLATGWVRAARRRN